MYKNKYILVTGAAGYIGSNLSKILIKKNFKVILIDNFSNSEKKTIQFLIKPHNKNVIFKKVDLTKQKEISEIFEKFNIDIVIHLAALKVISESIKFPKKYYFNNFYGTVNLLNEMKKNNVYKIIYSSSAAVYKSSFKKVNEKSKIKITNPYANSKYKVENYLKKINKKNKNWSIICLRYFNPIGTDDQNIFGETKFLKMNNIVSEISKVYLKIKKNVNIFGKNYNTYDGTCVRDFIDVRDLCMGHVKAIRLVNKQKIFSIINLGSGKGSTVLNIIKLFNSITKNKINYKYSQNRKEDIAISLADTAKAKQILKWNAKYTLKQSCMNQIKWLKKYYVN